MKKYIVEISIINPENVVETKAIYADNHDKALNIAAEMGMKYYNNGFNTWYRAI